MTVSKLQQKVIAELPSSPKLVGTDTLIWSHSPKAPIVQYARFFGERACMTNVRNPHDEALVLAFLAELEEADLDAITPEQPVAVPPSSVVQRTGFEVRIMVHPSVARMAFGHTTKFMTPATSLTFPAFICEFAADDTPDEAAYRVNKGVVWSKWDRISQPALSMRYMRTKSGVGTTAGKRLGVAPADQAEKVLMKIGEEDGFMEVENYKREVVTFRHEDGHYELELPSGSRRMEKDHVLGWFRYFLTSGIKGAEQPYG